jgi:CBS domain-containing membrane protein
MWWNAGRFAPSQQSCHILMPISSAVRRPLASLPTALHWLRGFWPAPMHASLLERIYAGLGAFLGLLFTGWVSLHALGGLNPWFIAPMGASAVLLFAVPASPLAQPWSIMGGNGVAALVGVSCARWIPDPIFAASLAAALSIALMLPLRCLHPPSGAVALTAVLGGPAVLSQGYHFALSPVLLNSGLLLAVALAFNNLLQRRYPHVHGQFLVTPRGTADLPPSERGGISRDDLAAALSRHAQLLDIDEADLYDLLRDAQRHAARREQTQLQASDIMSRDVLRVQPNTPLPQARQLLDAHHIKAVPVVDADDCLVGIISLHDLLVRASNASDASSTSHVADVMTRQVLTTHRTRPVAELVELFADLGVHHLPVLDNTRHVLGMITQSDMIAALNRLHLQAVART